MPVHSAKAALPYVAGHDGVGIVIKVVLQDQHSVCSMLRRPVRSMS